MTVEDILKNAYPSDLAEALVTSYREIEGNYALRKWKASELDAGHFVEAARRILEYLLFGSYTPIGKKLPNFTDAELKKYEQASGNDSLRILIPRVLRAFYNIRNNRGVGHLGAVSANEMDATYILYATKWVLAEFVRLGSTLDASQTQEAVDAIMKRQLSVIWKHDGITRVLATGIPAREAALILLYDRSPQSEDELRDAIEYSNPSVFRAILATLHKERLIEYMRGKPVHLTPKGTMRAEEVIVGLREKSV